MRVPAPRTTVTAPGAPRPLVPVSVGRAVSVFLLAGLVVVTAIGGLLALVQKRQATAEAIRDARTLTHLQAEDVVGPLLVEGALTPGPAYDALDAVVRAHVLGSLVVRVKIWDETGTVVYSDDRSLVGQRFPLPEDELGALRTGETVAEVSDLDEAENLGETGFDRLLQVYLGIRTTAGQPLLFETYQPYDAIRDSSARMWGSTLPVLVGGLALLYVVQVPLAYRMARRLRTAQEERELMLVASLAAADRERSRIASDLHDGVVQGLAGASWTLSAAASSARTSGDAVAAEQMHRTAIDLRRWVRELRSLIVTVAPPALHRQGLASALRDLSATLTSSGVAVELDVDDVGTLPQDVEALAYRVAQEAVRNVVRHAGARTVELSVRVEDGVLVQTVRDDGSGFDPSRSARGNGSVGLELLATLVAGQSGTLDITSAPGQGSTMVLRVPVTAVVPPVQRTPVHT